MKQFRIVLSMMLVISVLLSVFAFGYAENGTEEVWQADILKLIDAADVPDSASVAYNYDLPEGAELASRRYDCELVSSKGDVLNVSFDFMLNGVLLSDSQWNEVKDWLKNLVRGAVQHVQADANSIVTVVAQAYDFARRSAVPDAQGVMPVWANEGLLIRNITASVPYYPELSNGINGDATRRLQEKLIRLGYLDDRADGYFGDNTRRAVEELETYVRQLEQDVIEALPTPAPTATPAPAPTPAPGELPIVEDILIEATQEPEPTLEPATPVDGVAEPLLQAYLFSDSFRISRGDLRTGDQGDAVKRVQVRLTPRGEAMAQAQYREAMAFHTRVTARLTPEETRQLLDMLVRVSKLLEEDFSES